MLVFEYQHGICGILLCHKFRFVFLKTFILGNRELFRLLRVQSYRTNFHGRPSSKSFLKTFVIVKMDVFIPLREPTSAPTGHLLP